MRLLIQRVSQASVAIHGVPHAAIGRGLLVFLGIMPEDSEEDISWLVQKLLQLRIFSDESGLMNRSIQEVKGELLLVSQFTLYASTKKGNRPGFAGAARPETAIPLYEKMIGRLEEGLPGRVQTGIFGADMQVALINDGPVTIGLDSRSRE